MKLDVLKAMSTAGKAIPTLVPDNPSMIGLRTASKLE